MLDYKEWNETVPKLLGKTIRITCTDDEVYNTTCDYISEAEDDEGYNLPVIVTPFFEFDRTDVKKIEFLD